MVQFLGSTSVLGGFIGWREAVKAAMFLTTDNATAQAKLLLGPDSCLRLEPSGDEACIEMDDYDSALSILPDLAGQDFGMNRDLISKFLQQPVTSRERHYTGEK